MFKKNAIVLAMVGLVLGASHNLSSAKETMRVNSANVHLFLKKMAEQTKPGLKVNEYAKLKSSSATGKTFTAIIEMFLSDGIFVPDQFKTAEIKRDILAEERSLCKTKSLVAAIKYGATIERIYVNVEGTVLYKAKANKAYCSKIKA